MTAAQRLPDDYDVPAFHALRQRERSDAMGFLRPPLRATMRCSRTGPEIPRDYRRQAGRRRALSARRHTRRLHRAQRDDPRLSAQRGLGPARRSDRRSVVARRQDARRISSGSRIADHRPARAVPGSKFGINPSRHGWYGWLQTETADPASRVPMIAGSRNSLLVESVRAALDEIGQPIDGDRAGSTARPTRTTGGWSPRTPSACAIRR